MMTSSMCRGSRPARSTAARTAMVPSWVAVRDRSAPRNFPIGVRTAPIITGCLTTASSLNYVRQKKRPPGSMTGGLGSCNRRYSLSEVEIDLDIQFDIDRLAILHTRIEAPLLERLNRVFVESVAQLVNDARNVDRSVFADDCAEGYRSLESNAASFFRIQRFDAASDCWRAYASADAVNASSDTPAFTVAQARALSAADTTAGACADAATGSRSSGWWCK